MRLVHLQVLCVFIYSFFIHIYSTSLEKII
jgi:hypothetical protein